MPVFRLSVRRDGQEVETIRLAGGVVTIGRHASNSLVLDTPQASRYHAAITLSAARRTRISDGNLPLPATDIACRQFALFAS